MTQPDPARSPGGNLGAGSVNGGSVNDASVVGGKLRAGSGSTGGVAGGKLRAGSGNNGGVAGGNVGAAHPGAGSGEAWAPDPARPWITELDGRRLRQLRRQRGLSQVELAGQAGVGLATLTRLERQPRAACRCRTLARLAAALGEPPAALTPG